jgi:hypothetical protein
MPIFFNVLIFIFIFLFLFIYLFIIFCCFYKSFLLPALVQRHCTKPECPETRLPRQSVHKSMRATISRDLPARTPGIEGFQTHQTTLHILK